VVQAEIHAQQGEAAEALAAYDRAVALAPLQSSLYGNRAALHRRNRHFDAARADLTRSIELATSSDAWTRHVKAEALHARGEIYLEDRQLDESIEDFSAAIELSPRTIEYLKSRATARIRLGG